MKFLRITAANATRQYIPDNYVVGIAVTADTLDSGSEYSAAKVIRGRISQVKYYDGTSGQGGAAVVTSVSAYTTGGILYEYGCFTVDGAFVAALSN